VKSFHQLAKLISLEGFPLFYWYHTETVLYTQVHYCLIPLYAIAVLNHAGVCMSYKARYLEVVREGHWIWVYDNVNIHQNVRHEREGEP